MYKYKLKIKEEKDLGPKQFQNERMLGFDKIGDLVNLVALSSLQLDIQCKFYFYNRLKLPGELNAVEVIVH